MTLMFTWKLRDMNNKFATESRLGNIVSKTSWLYHGFAVPMGNGGHVEIFYRIYM